RLFIHVQPKNNLLWLLHFPISLMPPMHLNHTSTPEPWRFTMANTIMHTLPIGIKPLPEPMRKSLTEKISASRFQNILLPSATMAEVIIIIACCGRYSAPLLVESPAALWPRLLIALSEASMNSRPSFPMRPLHGLVPAGPG